MTQFRLLSDVLPGVSATDSPTVVARGSSARILAVGPDHVLKVFGEGAADSMIEREAAASRLAQQQGLPTAGALDLIDYEGARGILFPRIAGVAMQVALQSRPYHSPSLLRQWVRLCADMHAVRPNHLRSYKELCKTDLAFGPLPQPAKDAAIAYLEGLPDGDRLLHGDLHVGNFILSDGDIFIVDWSKAAIGNPAADIARMDMLMRFGVGPGGVITGLWRDWAARKSLRDYSDVVGGQARALAAWRPVVALTWLRVGLPMRTEPFLQYANRALDLVGLPRIDPAVLAWAD